jgi:glutamate-1-semialdehyde 2,1-aminomutase
MGNGFPIAAIGGKREVMASVGPGRTAHGGTYCGNVVGTAAADATLGIIAEGKALATIQARGQVLMDGLSDILTGAGIPSQVLGVPGMFGIVLAEGKPVDYRSWAEGDSGLYEEIMMALVHNGAAPDPDGREPWFLCAALTEQDVADTLTYFEDAVRTVKDG